MKLWRLAGEISFLYPSRLIRAVAERISLAVENARLVTETQVSLTETERLYLSAQIVNSDRTEAEILTALYEQFALLNHTMMFVLYSPERNSVGYPARLRQILRKARSKILARMKWKINKTT